MYNKNDINLSI